MTHLFTLLQLRLRVTGVMISLLRGREGKGKVEKGSVQFRKDAVEGCAGTAGCSESYP